MAVLRRRLALAAQVDRPSKPVVWSVLQPEYSHNPNVIFVEVFDWSAVFSAGVVCVVILSAMFVVKVSGARNCMNLHCIKFLRKSVLYRFHARVTGVLL